jgi:hypothetical protein
VADSLVADFQQPVPVTVLFDPRLLESIDQLKSEWKLRSRDAVINRLLMEAVSGSGDSSVDVIEMEWST